MNIDKPKDSNPEDLRAATGSEPPVEEIPEGSEEKEAKNDEKTNPELPLDSDPELPPEPEKQVEGERPLKGTLPGDIIPKTVEEVSIMEPGVRWIGAVDEGQALVELRYDKAVSLYDACYISSGRQLHRVSFSPTSDSWSIEEEMNYFLQLCCTDQEICNEVPL